ncbi:MAG: hypothetical protein AB4040_02840 [Synechococcus sp.]
MFSVPTYLALGTALCGWTTFGQIAIASEPERAIEFTSPSFQLGVEQENVEHEWVNFTVEDSDEAIARFGCDDLFCINFLRAQRGQGPLQLEFTPDKASTESE